MVKHALTEQNINLTKPNYFVEINWCYRTFNDIATGGLHGAVPVYVRLRVALRSRGWGFADALAHKALQRQKLSFLFLLLCRQKSESPQSSGPSWADSVHGRPSLPDGLFQRPLPRTKGDLGTLRVGRFPGRQVGVRHPQVGAATARIPH